jgi:hypothetical protein
VTYNNIHQDNIRFRRWKDGVFRDMDEEDDEPKNWEVKGQLGISSIRVLNEWDINSKTEDPTSISMCLLRE